MKKKFFCVIVIMIALICVLTSCGECNHEYYNGVCSSCNLQCLHEFVDEICTICSYKCEHAFVDGICSVCNFKCEHDFHNEVCTICGYNCEHAFVDGICSVCNFKCKHETENNQNNKSKCSICGKILNLKLYLPNKNFKFSYYELSWDTYASEADKTALMTRFGADSEKELFDKIRNTIESALLLTGCSYFDLYESYKFSDNNKVTVVFLTSIEKPFATNNEDLIFIDDHTFRFDKQYMYTYIESEEFKGITITVWYSL